MSVRERIAEFHASETAPSVETPIVAPVTEHESVTTIAPEAHIPVEDVEPDETSFDDPSAYRKAVREYDKKQVAKQIKEEHDKVIDGLYKDLRKQRAGKRELRSELDQIKQQITSFTKPSQLEEPKWDGNVDSYAQKVAAYQIAKEREAGEIKQREQRDIESNNKIIAFDQEQKRNNAKKDLPDLDKVIERVREEKIGDGIVDKAIRQINSSEMTWHIYHFLGSNPDVTDKIEDLSPTDQVLAIKQIESKLREVSYKAQPASNKVTSTSPDSQNGNIENDDNEAVVKPISKPAIKAPLKAAKGGSDVGHKPLTGSMDMATYISRRSQARKSGQW